MINQYPSHVQLLPSIRVTDVQKHVICDDIWWPKCWEYMGIYVLVGGLEHFFIFHNILGIIIPTDFHIFQRGWNHHDVQSEVAWALLSSLPAWQGAIGAVTWEGIAFRVFQHTGWSANLGETREIPWFIMINHCTIWIATWGYINISHYYHTQPYLKPKSESSLADWPLVWPFAISCSIHTLIGWTLCSHDLTCEYAGYSSIGEDTLWLVVWNIFFHILGIIIPTGFHIFQRGRYTTNQPSCFIEVRDCRKFRCDLKCTLHFLLEGGYLKEMWRSKTYNTISGMKIHERQLFCYSPQCEARKIAKLVYNSNKYGLWYLYVLVTIVTGANLNQLITGGPHIAEYLCLTHKPVFVQNAAWDPEKILRSWREQQRSLDHVLVRMAILRGMPILNNFKTHPYF